jgi:hypothetical protein
MDQHDQEIEAMEADGADCRLSSLWMTTIP